MEDLLTANIIITVALIVTVVSATLYIRLKSIELKNATSNRSPATREFFYIHFNDLILILDGEHRGEYGYHVGYSPYDKLGIYKTGDESNPDCILLLGKCNHGMTQDFIRIPRSATALAQQSLGIERGTRVYIPHNVRVGLGITEEDLKRGRKEFFGEEDNVEV